MELKKYQLRVRDEVKAWLTELAKQQASGNKHAALDAWETVRVPGRRYAERKSGLEKVTRKATAVSWTKAASARPRRDKLPFSERNSKAFTVRSTARFICLVFASAMARVTKA